MFKLLWLKILIYGLVVAKIAPFLVEKRDKVLDHALSAAQDDKLKQGDTNSNSPSKKGVIVRDLSDSSSQDRTANTPKIPSEVMMAVSKLDELEKQLQIYPQNFIEHRETIRNQIQANIDQSEHDYERLYQKLGSIENTSPASINKILQWMKVKKKEIDLYKEDLKLINDITSTVTKLEAAKYISLNNINSQNYYENPYQPPYYTYPYQYDTSNWNYPYNYYMNYYQQTTDNSPTYYANEQSKYDIFNKVFNKYLKNYGNIHTYNVDSGSLGNGYPSGIMPSYTGNSRQFIMPVYDNSYDNKKNSLYNVYTPQNYAVDNSKTYTKPSLSEVTPKKSEISTQETKKAVQAINYLQDKLGLDTMSVLKLISELKDTTKNEMQFHKKQLQNNLLEYKRSSIEKPPDTVTKRSLIAPSQKAFLESRDKYWLIKQVEWFITRLEAAKYAAMSKII